MVKLAVVGSNEFVVGFQLAGIKQVTESGGSPFESIRGFKSRKDIGIVIVDEKIMEKLDIHQKFEIESSNDPVFIPLSEKSEQDGLKRLIKKSIGVDLWK